MTTPFELAIRFTMVRIESGGDPDGGYNDRPSDRGGPTKYGISQAAYPHLDIRNLTRDQAIEIYRTDYWLEAHCDKLPRAVAIAHFDCAVNSGVEQAAELLQRAFGATPDGDIGPKTLASLRSFLGGRDPVQAAELIIEQRARFYADLVDEPEKPQERQNLKSIEGWTVRLVRLSFYVCRNA